ncbi:hypothetical protein [Micromonospora sp. HM5-17]|uniref:hypothetical protein n=1 Tax=Micromonospora sp. HM5-17 TaxID=2487710 RepID=UPI001F2892B8|nr:hypothetical protein [Micromonospora sp. HM5-17]
MADGPPERGCRWGSGLDRLLDAVPARRVVLIAAACGAVAGAVLAGPVAALVLATYAGLAARVGCRRRAGRLARRMRRVQLDGLAALAADLRAGLPPSALLSAPAGVDPAPSSVRLAELTRAAVRLAEQTGAPLAELLERIEADARAMDRGLAAADAQAAGARATAGLLALLPLGGIALGYGIGADPLRVLLHTPVGAACAVGAIVLQLAGLAWAERLGSTRVAG